VLRGVDQIVGDWSRDGVRLHAETIAAHAANWARLLPLLVIPLWLGGLALVAIAVAVILG
jgi:hypothetical protein